MRNYFKNVWFGALLYPARWHYTSNASAVIGGVLLTLSCVLFMFFKTAVIIGAVTLLVWAYVITKADKIYLLKNVDKTLSVALFYTGKRKTVARFDKKSQSALFRLSVVNGDRRPKFLVSDIFGYDDKFSELGLFLYKVTYDDWTLVSCKYYNTLLLGKCLKENLFKTESQNAQEIVTFIHCDTAVRYEVDYVKLEPKLTYDRNKAKYKPLSASLPNWPEFRYCSRVCLQHNGRAKLFLFGINSENVPTAFQVMVSYAYHNRQYRNNSTPIPVNREDGSFVYHLL